MRTLFFVIIVAFTSIASCQNTSTDHSFQLRIEQRILGDSITYSWEQANHFVNGLEAANRLRIIEAQLEVELNALKLSYDAAAVRIISYEDTIVPAHILKNIELVGQIDSHVQYEGDLETELKTQKNKKWKWLIYGGAIGYVLNFFFGG